ncbi:MAG: hypothetical protein KGL77_06130 [Actinomycetales bacterium]|nr:hypothetical protein [Actinomycetales bacterium]
MPKKSAIKPAPVAGKKKRKFGFADAIIIVSVACLAFVGWTVYYGTNIAPAEGKAKDVAACVAFNEGLGKAHAAFTSNDNKGYIDEFFKGNDAAMLAADPQGSLNELLIQVGMQRMSINYDMDAMTLMNYLEPLAQRVQGEDYCAAILNVKISTTAPTVTPTP